MDIGRGRVVAGRYRLTTQLGSGGMGEVWRAEHVMLRSDVAVKLIDPAYLAEPEASARFLREARAAAALRSPHIVHVFDYGVEDGVPYMVMELLEGESLGTRLSRVGRLPFADVVRIVSQVARGIGKAHQAGIVHRDLKPDNVFLVRGDDDEVVKVLDFGVAKLTGPGAEQTATSRTITGTAVGTPSYMSPEQVFGTDAVDHRSDLWALAVITFECVTGQRPFQGRGLGELVMQICVSPVPAPSSVAPVPEGFDAWFARATERDPDGRFPSAGEMAEALRGVGGGGARRSGTYDGGRLSRMETGRSRAPAPREAPATGSRPRAATGGAALYAEIEDPTRLRQRVGKGYRAVVDECRHILRTAVAAAGVVEADADAEGMSAIFAAGPQALGAAVDAQRALAEHQWPQGGLVRVRVALHALSGAAPPGAAPAATGAQTAMTQTALRRAEQIARAAHGGQILLSDTLHASVVGHLSAGVTLLDLGRHQLEEGEEAEHLYQVVVPGLPSDFPPPRSAGATPNNLPAEATEFVGRRGELRRVHALLGASRLVTLVGPGGTGKTRLALRAAAQLLPEFPDGVYFVPLAALSDAAFLGSAVAAGLGVPEPHDRPVLDAIVEHLAPRQVLLVLDNVEQIAGAAPEIGRLLDGAPGLRVLVTSRVALRLPREQVFPVPPLELPAADGAADVEALASIDGVALFLRRARASEPSFDLTAENAAAVVRIVTRLEGLPLAIELAAARIPLFSPEVLARRLERGFELLRGTARDLPARHRTLRDTVAWSYALLDDAEQTALRRLGVFAGGFTLEAVAGVIASPPVDDAGDVLASLVNKSLVRREVSQGEPRVSMLESIREFAQEELETSGEAHEIRRRHAAHFLAIAEAAEPALRRPEQAAVQDRLTADEANLRAALRFCLASGDAESGLRIGGAVWRFWQSAGRLEEGRRWLSDLLDLPGTPPPARAKGLSALAGLAYWQGDYATALEHYRLALELYDRVGDAFGVADTLFSMSTASSWGGDPAAGARLAEEALARFEAIGAREQIGMVRMAQGFARWMQGDLAGARPLWESSIAIAREVGDHVEAAHKRLALASLTSQEGHHARAMDEAFDALEELQEHGNVALTVMALDWIAALGAEREPEPCARLAGAAAELRRTLGGGMRPDASGLTSARDTVARLLDRATLERAWREGSRMRLHEAVRYARALRGRLAGV